MNQGESQRLEKTYEDRDRDFVTGFQSEVELIASLYWQRAVFRLLKREKTRLGDCRIADFGSGTGARLREMQRLGADAKNLHGIELSKFRLSYAREQYPSFQMVEGDCVATPWKDGGFDIVMNSTMMSSVLDDSVARGIASEMRRVLKPDGFLLWYDFRFDNPSNLNVRGYDRDRISGIFEGWDIRLQLLTVAPPLRRLCSPLPCLYHLCHALVPLRSHYVGILRPRS